MDLEGVGDGVGDSVGVPGSSGDEPQDGLRGRPGPGPVGGEDDRRRHPRSPRRQDGTVTEAGVYFFKTLLR